MILMADAVGKDVGSLFPARRRDECSVGQPEGPGIRIGYEGWGEPDLALDPVMPLDMCVERLGLSGAFPRVASKWFLNCIHGDCNLTHAARGLQGLVARQGTLTLSVLATANLARDAIKRLDDNDFRGCFLLEKFCFAQARDLRGFLFQQSFMNLTRLRMLVRELQMVSCQDAKGTDGLPRHPDEVRLPGVPDEAWASGAGNNRMQDSLDHDRPSCILCGRMATRMDHNRAFFSRYCKDHYHQARQACDAAIRDAYMIKLELRKK